MRKADNLPPSCAVVTKSGNLNFLEPSGSVQACNGTALSFIIQSIFLSTVTVYRFYLNCYRLQARKGGGLEEGNVNTRNNEKFEVMPWA
jgi:hypothetical protein